MKNKKTSSHIPLQPLILKNQMIRVSQYDTEELNQLYCSYIVRISNFLTLHITLAQPESCFTVCHFQNPTMVPISVSVKISCKRNQYSIFQANSSKENERKYQKSAHFFPKPEISVSESTDKGNSCQFSRSQIHFHYGNTGTE